MDSPMKAGCGSCGGSGSRNLVVCIDGTSNKFGENNTNVIKLYSHLPSGDDQDQLTYYSNGIGTYASPNFKSVAYYRQVVDHTVDMAIAWNIESIILEAYRWLTANYRTGDTLYFFGFSRGAYQVRALSAMIDKVGLTRRGNEKQIPFAYEKYASLREEISEGGFFSFSSKANKSQAANTMAASFKKTFSHPSVKVHFVGAWDTVASVGLGTKVLPYTAAGMTHVCHFRHALALDERRVKFEAQYANDSEGSSSFGRYTGSKPQIKEVWFPGVHSDVGGKSDLGTLSLGWMADEAKSCGLLISEDFDDTEYLQRPGLARSNSLMKVAKDLASLTATIALEFAPIPRLSSRVSKLKDQVTVIPHLFGGRKIMPGQLIHSSVIHVIRGPQPGDDLMNWPENYNYTPAARLPHDVSWDFMAHLNLKDDPDSDVERTEYGIHITSY